MFNEDLAEKLITEARQKRKHTYYCQKCGVVVSRGAKYCAQCIKTIPRKRIPVSKQDLKDLLRTTSFSHTAAQYGVSDNAVRKWCKRYGLPTHSKEIHSMTDAEWDAL